MLGLRSRVWGESRAAKEPSAQSANVVVGNVLRLPADTLDIP